MGFKTVLVTGCGGDLGISISRILKMTGISNRVIGCDIHLQHPGKLILDKCELVPRADSEFYLENLIKIIKKYAVDLVIPASEAELRFFYANGLYHTIENIPIIIANEKALAIGFDKLKTANFLESCHLPYPWTKIVKEGVPEKFPCIIKSRFGAGSREVSIVDQDLVDYYTRKRPDDLWQEYLSPDDQEYTCGVYGLKNGEARCIIIKRRLQGGHTVYGEVHDNSLIEKLLISVAKEMDLRGSINVQLRLTDKGPVIFEINPRFSSTVVFRHLMGFQDLIWSISELEGRTLSCYKPVNTWTIFYRGDCEYIVPIEQES